MITVSSRDDRFHLDYDETAGTKTMIFSSREIEVPRTSGCVKFINDSILKGMDLGFTDFVISFDTHPLYPNNCAPIAGLLDFYKDAYDLTFDLRFPINSYAGHTQMEQPFTVEEILNEFAFGRPFDRVWRVRSEQGISRIVSSYVFGLRQTEGLADGIAEGVEWTLGEVLDNVLQHSDSTCGYVMAQIHETQKRVSFCVFDTGIGIFNTLISSGKYSPQNPLAAIKLALQERVTRDDEIGQGNGLWGMSNMISLSNGSFRVASGGAEYRNIGGKITTREFGELNLGSRLGTTLVDFQIDYSKPIDVSMAFPGYDNYTYVDLWLENLETDYEGTIVSLKVKDLAVGGTNSRRSGKKFFNLVANIIELKHKRVILDFAGLSVISSSFADETVGKLVARYGFVDFVNLFQFANMSGICRQLVNRAIEQRAYQNFDNT